MLSDSSHPSRLPESVKKQVLRVLASPSEERPELLRDVYEAHPEFADEIRGEVEAHDSVQRCLQEATTMDGEQDASDGTPEWIGSFRILEVIGEGGMGTVYLAEQKEPVRRRVALKVIKPGMDTQRVLLRFEAERQALAMMEHDNIAKVFEAGSTERGRPYFVMEFVKGVPITTYCDDHRLSIPQRLALLRGVCAGVQHAHQKGIIHRDLKPSNVLVTVQDGEPTPKIIDFGLARATDHRLTEKTLYSELGRIVGTLEYMSPEQAGLRTLDIDTRTDVYSLGVVLYELLTGDLPFRAAQLRNAALDEIQRMIREDDPPKPSTRISESGELARHNAERRRLDHRGLHRRVMGDLDWITMKALEKDRTRRYETPSALSEDLRRFLEDEPVSARPPSVSYRLGKLIRKYRGQFIAASLIFVTLLAGVAGMTVFAISAEANAVRASENEARAMSYLSHFNLLFYRLELDERTAEAKTLFPAWPVNVPRMAAWIEKARAIRDSRDEVVRARRLLRAEAVELERIAAELDSIATSSSAASVGEESLRPRRARLRARVAELESRVPTPSRRFLLTTLDRLADDLETFAAAGEGLFDDVASRLEWARSIRARSIDHHARAWRSAGEAVRTADDVVASKRYRGSPFTLVPQMGLVPIGIDPKSKLLEFGHPASGAVPKRDPTTGELLVDGESSLVFVLVPGGTGTFGATPKRGEKHFDRDAELPESPVHELELDPFFLSKYEMTHAQWNRLAAWHVDARHDAAALERKEGFETKPIVRVSWNACKRLCEVHGLALPTEAQWEYACRAGSSTPWSSGSEISSLAGYANVADLTSRRAFRTPEGEIARFRDGHIGRAPVFEFEGNGFGFHSMHGNVWEWCRDRAVRYEKPFSQRGDGLRVGRRWGEGDRFILRGGSFIDAPRWARSAKRNHSPASYEANVLGLRPARALKASTDEQQSGGRK